MTETSVPARLLAYSPRGVAAFPELCAVALVESPVVFTAPGAPPHCVGLMQWDDDLIPLVDLLVLVEGGNASHREVPPHVLVVAWQSAGGEGLRYGAVCAPHLVTTIRVSDEQQREAPEDGRGLRSVAAGFFEVDGQVAAIIDTRRLFGGSIFP